MLYYLARFSENFGPLRLFDYITFRAGGAALTAFLIVLILGGPTSRVLKRLNAQAADRYQGIFPPDQINQEKNKIPSMGGILIVGAIAVAAALWNAPNMISIVLISSMIGFASIGFYDDIRKVVYKDRNGIPAKLKLILQFIVAGAAVWGLYANPETSEPMRQFMVPFLKNPLFSSSWVAIFSILVIVGASNAVNITDGEDGLATGCSIFCTLTYALFAYLMGHRIFAEYLNISHIPTAGEAVVFGAALVGSCIGFLWHNCSPASMFMGDTGSLALGGVIGLLAVIVRQELLLALVGGVFVLEIVSVMLQVSSFKLTGKRIFLCTPIHHHFERKGWSETQIVVRFWIIAGVCALLAIATLKLR